jgi:ATP/ADP translocase
VKAKQLFARVPTLRALFCEVISFQSLNTILNVAFVSGLKASIPNDLERSSYTGRLYSSINAASAVIQFVLMPALMKFAEPVWIWRLMPAVPAVVCAMQAVRPNHSLSLLATAFFVSKTLDYSVRSVVYAMVYQVRPEI